MKLKRLNDPHYKLRKCWALFESRDDLLKELDVITQDLGIPAMVVGGSALPKYNFNRVTEDIDIVVPISDASRLITVLLKRGLKPIGKYNKLLHNNGMKIDINTPGVNFPEPESKKIGISYASLPLLLALKIKVNSDRRPQDTTDVIRLMMINKLSLEYIKTKVWKYLDDSNKERAVELWKKAQIAIEEEKIFEKNQEDLLNAALKSQGFKWPIT